ncbi:MAG: restriction endonuclease subunit S [Cyclobacteriaceae bacterium]
MEELKKVPKIRFKGFDGEWKSDLLGTHASFSKGSGYSKSDLVTVGSPIILYGRLYTNYSVIIHKVKTFAIPKEETVYSKGNEVIVPASGETAGDIARASAILSEGLIIGGDLNIVYPDRFINPVFLALNISYSNTQKLLAKKAQGKSVVHLRITDLKDTTIVYPANLSEQTRIGTFFQSLDKLLTLHQQQYTKLTNLKKAMLEKMFPRPGADTPEIRFKGFEGKWEEKDVSHLCSISTGKSNTQDRNYGGYFPFYVRSAVIERSNKYLFDEEAVLTVGDGVGTGKVYHYVNGKYDLHQRVYRMFDFKNVSGLYFYYYFSINFHKRVMAMTAKTSVDSVRLEMIAEMSILFPSLQEQHKISTFFQNLDRMIFHHQTRLTKLRNIKKACLEKMFV